MADLDLSPVAAAIAAHRGAFAASLEALERVLSLRQDFDPELRLEAEDEVSRALVARYGDQAGAKGLAFWEAEAEANRAAEAEDAAWLAVRALVPASRTQVREWLAYVVDHSRMQDEAVNLRAALTHACGLLADQLAA